MTQRLRSQAQQRRPRSIARSLSETGDEQSFHLLSLIPGVGDLSFCWRQFFDAQVAVADSFSIVVILQTDVAPTRARFRIDPCQDQFSVHPNGVILVDA